MHQYQYLFLIHWCFKVQGIVPEKKKEGPWHILKLHIENRINSVEITALQPIHVLTPSHFSRFLKHCIVPHITHKQTSRNNATCAIFFTPSLNLWSPHKGWDRTSLCNHFSSRNLDANTFPAMSTTFYATQSQCQEFDPTISHIIVLRNLAWWIKSECIKFLLQCHICDYS